MLWEIVYCIVFFVFPLVGMFTAIAVGAYRNVDIDEIVEETLRAKEDTKRKIVNRVYSSNGNTAMWRIPSIEPQGIIIDFLAYKEHGVIKVLKRRMYSRDGPGDTS